MIGKNVTKCPKCGGGLKYYDSVKRITLTKYRERNSILLRRFKCVVCCSIHREMSDTIFPYKHYETEMIKGVLDGFVTPSILGFEDYPCEATMNIWKKQFGQT